MVRAVCMAEGVCAWLGRVCGWGVCIAEGTCKAEGVHG